MEDFWGQVLQRAPQLIERGGIIIGLIFTGLALRADLRSRHAEVLIKLTENHQALWMYYEKNPRLRRIFDPDADLGSKPLTRHEARFLQFFINHVAITFRTQKLGLYVSPEKLDMDLREFFERPLPRAAWEKLSRFQDKDFAAYIFKLIPNGTKEMPS